MSFAGRHLLPLLMVLPAIAAARAQKSPAPDYFRQIALDPAVPAQLPGPEGLREYVVDGKLRLALADAIRLMLLNNTDVHLDRTAVDHARYAILSAYRPFDPLLVSNLNALRSTTPATNQLVGAPTLSNLNQGGQVGFLQLFQTGTNTSVTFNGTRSATNSSFYFINPYLTSSLSFLLTQPLLRNRGLFPNRAPIVIARRNLNQSQANFEAQVNNLIQQAVLQYWGVVGARENLRVVRDSLDEAEASYKHDKRALELGALSPLEIYRTESQVAQRRVAAIQAEYQLKQAEDQFRQIIGADLDLYVRALDLDLVENPEPQGELATTDVKTALEQALKRRPELEALRQLLANDDTSIRLAHNGLLPDLELVGSYSSNGVGGNQFSSLTTPPTLIAGGFGDALSQIAQFRYPTYGVTLSFNFPVRNRSAQSALGIASVNRRNDLYLLRREQQAITLDVLNSVHQLEQAKLSIAAAKIARDLARKTLESEQRKYELGAGQIFLVLESQTELTQAEVTLVQAEVSYQRALVDVDRAKGGLLDRYHVRIADVAH